MKDHSNELTLSSYIDLVVGASEPEAWTTFFIRCEQDADDAFRMIYEEAVVRFGRALTKAVAEEIGCGADDEMPHNISLVSITRVRNESSIRSTQHWRRSKVALSR